MDGGIRIIANFATHSVHPAVAAASAPPFYIFRVLPSAHSNNLNLGSELPRFPYKRYARTKWRKNKCLIPTNNKLKFLQLGVRRKNGHHCGHIDFEAWTTTVLLPCLS